MNIVPGLFPAVAYTFGIKAGAMALVTPSSMATRAVAQLGQPGTKTDGQPAFQIKWPKQHGLDVFDRRTQGFQYTDSGSVILHHKGLFVVFKTDNHKDFVESM